MSFAEVAVHEIVCALLALLAYAGSRRRHPLAFTAPVRTVVDAARPYHARAEERLVAVPPPWRVRGAALLGLTLAVSAPGWAAVTLMVTMLALDPPPPPAMASVATVLCCSAPLGLVAGVLLGSSSLALLRADARAVARAKLAMTASATLLVGMGYVVWCSLPWASLDGLKDALFMTIHGGPALTFGAALLHWAVARRRAPG